jgi:hypothetical protein
LSLGGPRQKPIGALNFAKIREKVELKTFSKSLSGKVWKGLQRAKK